MPQKMEALSVTGKAQHEDGTVSRGYAISRLFIKNFKTILKSTKCGTIVFIVTYSWQF